jgi:Pyridoxamine 5'-phosphate oxidase
MTQEYDEIDDTLRNWLARQPMFFVATAPLAADGHVNLSPKGMAGTFAVFGPRRIGYLDYFGSGVETIAHLRENGRIAVMLCAFDGPPKTVRLHGSGRVVRPDDADFGALRARFGSAHDRGVRAIVVVDVDRIADSCGFAVPQMQHVADRDLLTSWHDARPDGFFDSYANARNAASIDGLPGLR